MSQGHTNVTSLLIVIAVLLGLNLIATISSSALGQPERDVRVVDGDMEIRGDLTVQGKLSVVDPRDESMVMMTSKVIAVAATTSGAVVLLPGGVIVKDSGGNVRATLRLNETAMGTYVGFTLWDTGGTPVLVAAEHMLGIALDMQAGDASARISVSPVQARLELEGGLTVDNQPGRAALIAFADNSWLDAKEIHMGAAPLQHDYAERLETARSIEESMEKSERSPQ